MKFNDRGSDIVIITDTLEESVSKKKFVAENSGGALRVHGQNISPSDYIFSEITYPIFADIDKLVAELNRWADGNDFHYGVDINFVLSFNGISELADKYVDATTITSVTFDTGIATLQFSTDGTNFTNFTAPVSFVANTNVRWKVTFNTGFTLGAIEMKGYKN